MSSITHGLNAAQAQAVNSIQGPLLILAGAGAGKTKTLTHRILNLVMNGVKPDSILAITFTNKAAKEMRERVHNLLKNHQGLNTPVSMPDRPFVSTFHSLGVYILKEQHVALGIPRHFTIYDRNDSKRAVKDALEKLGFDAKQFDPMKILGAISREKGDYVSHEQYVAKSKDFFSTMVGRVWEEYTAILRKEQALDFDDLLYVTARLLEKREDIRAIYTARWKYIHIDEYQDTNRVQYVISKLLTGESQNICVVGDIDQNIYSWRGANIENILNFEKDYPSAQVILLEENYRSTQTILKAANAVIEKNVVRRKKTLFTNNGEGERIALIEAYDENDEAREIAEAARELVKKGVKPGEIAVLYRANYQSRVLEEAFLHKNVPYQILGTRFFERKEVKDVLSFIRAGLNPEAVGDVARIINIPPRGIGKVTLAKIAAGEEETLSGSVREKIQSFRQLLGRIGNSCTTLEPSEAVKYVIKETGIEFMLRDGSPDDVEKLENVRELVTLATKYDGLPNGEGIELFLSDAALASDQDELTEEREGVRLMTVHASKGLEFEYVFISGLEQDLFPHARFGEGEISESAAEEERRLFYVALTRARKKLYLCWAQIRTIFGSQRVNQASEFIEDIDSNLIETSVRETPRGVKAIFIDF